MRKYQFNLIYVSYLLLLLFLIFLSLNINSYDPEDIKLNLSKEKYSDLPNWKDNFNFEIKKAFESSCYIITKNNISYEEGIYNFKKYFEFCSQLKLINDGPNLRSLIEEYFDPYSYKKVDAKYTGYVELTVKGTKVQNFKENSNAVPLLKKPKNLITVDLNLFDDKFKNYKLKGLLKDNKVIPFPSRETIESLEYMDEDVLAYVNDPAHAFFLHIQGSGKIIFSDKSVMYVRYADNNGKIYTSIGKELLAMNELELKDISMQSILNWMQNNKGRAKKLRNLNERYIFFEERDKFVYGSSGAKLIPMHSVAVDNSFIPFHIPIWAVIDKYKGSNTNKLNHQGLFIAHDTGAAIKGPMRFDLFLGSGNENELLAGNLNSKGAAWLLLPKK